MKTRISALACALLVLASCSTYKKFETPVLDVQFTDTIPSPSWRDAFPDTCLHALVDSALKYNADYNTALLRTEEARKKLTGARLKYLPSVSAAPGVSYTSSSSVQPVYDLGIDASWEIDLFGKLTAEKRLAEATLGEMQAAAQAARTRVICTVAEAYYTLLALDRQLQISEQTIVTWDKSIQVIEALKLAGRSNDIAVQQSKAKMLNLKASTVALRGKVETAESALCTLVGMPICKIRRGTIDAQSLPEFEDGIPAGYIAARPDVLAAEKRLAEAYYATAVASAAFYPSLKLSGGAGWTNYSSGKVFDPMQIVTSAAAGLLEPIFARGQIVVDHEGAKLRQQEALAACRQAVLEAGNEVNTALVQCSASHEKVALDRAQQEALSTSVEKITLLMRYSTASYLEVLTAQQSLLDSQLLLVQDQLAEISGHIALYAALGGDR